MEAATEDMSGDVQQEADDTYKQVLDEVGLELVGDQAVPSTKIKGKQEEKAKGKDEVSDLEKRLQDLKS